MRKPWTQTWRGASRPALHNIAGQKIEWKRTMSLPMMWRSAGHQRADDAGAGSGGEAAPLNVVKEPFVPDVDLAGLGAPRAVLAQRRLAVLGDRERDPPVA